MLKILPITQLTQNERPENITYTMQSKCVGFVHILGTHPTLLGDNGALIPSLIKIMNIAIYTNRKSVNGEMEVSNIATIVKEEEKNKLIFVESVRSQTNKQTNESTCRACQYMWIQCDKMESHEINCNAFFGESISTWKYKACV